jgi:hypothetical protein
MNVQFPTENTESCRGTDRHFITPDTRIKQLDTPCGTVLAVSNGAPPSSALPHWLGLSQTFATLKATLWRRPIRKRAEEIGDLDVAPTPGELEHNIHDRP